MTSSRDAVIDAAIYMTIHECPELSPAGIHYMHPNVSPDVIDAALVRLADDGLVHSTPDGKWKVRAVTT